MDFVAIAAKVACLEQCEAKPGAKQTPKERLAEAREEMRSIPAKIERTKVEIRVLHYLRPLMDEIAWYQKMEALVATLRYYKRRFDELGDEIRLVEKQMAAFEREARERAVAAGGIEPH